MGLPLMHQVWARAGCQAGVGPPQPLGPKMLRHSSSAFGRRTLWHRRGATLQKRRRRRRLLAMLLKLVLQLHMG